MPDHNQVALVLASSHRLAMSVMRVDWKWRQTDMTHFFDPAGRAIEIVTHAERLHGREFGTPVYLCHGWYEDRDLHAHFGYHEEIGRFVVHDAVTGSACEPGLWR